MSKSKLLLASQSRYRRQLLDRLRLPYETIDHGIEEVPDPSLTPHEQVARLAVQKAENVRPRRPDALIIASDQGLVFDHGLLGKPGTVDAACAQLESMAGGAYDLVTAIAVLDGPSGRMVTHTEVNRLVFRDLAPRAIRRYVELDQPLDCAGSFRIESLGPVLFERIESNDPTSIMGLPLLKLAAILEAFGVSPLGS